MSDKEKEEDVEEAPPKPSAAKVLISSALSAIVLGGVAAGVAFVIPGGAKECAVDPSAKLEKKEKAKNYEDVAFVNLEPLVISLGPDADSQYLKISITLETSQPHLKGIEHLKPKFRDVLNVYLRAVDESDLTEPAAMTRLRAQMLRRMQLVAPPDAIDNVLITDFVLN
jgi:flagellar FliL protein